MFEKLKVLDLSSVLAGPATGMFFAELGSQVIKVENKRSGGDITRQWKLPSESPESPASAYYSSVNQRKELRMLDFTLREDRKQVYTLAKDADILLSNYKPGDDKKLGMDYGMFRDINPRIIYAHLTGFGEHNPRIAYDVVLQAEAGYMYMNGTPESGPVKMPIALIDIIAAHQLKEGILVALLQREKTGKGSLVTVSLYDAALSALCNQASNWLMANHIPQRIGSLHPNIAPYGELFKTRDNKEIVLAVGSNTQFRELCRILGDASIAKDARFLNNTQRVLFRKTLADELAPLFLLHDREDLLYKFNDVSIPAGAVKNMKEVFDTPEAQSMILTSDAGKDGLMKGVKTVGFSIIS